ncbi:MAG: glutamate 5-kinase [Patescibacteria group bacterium]|nr:glutamate 5-kinase [Patescibacteria group bacterium]
MKNLVIIKYGSSCISRKNIRSFAKQVAKLKSEGKEVLVVSSGSVRLGKEIGVSSINAKGSLGLWASLGSARIVELWRLALERHGIVVAQILVTHSDLDESSYLKLSLEELLAEGVVPVVNENDVLSDTELVKLKTGGDNDGLAAHIALRLEAETLILVSSGVNGYVSGGSVQAKVDLSSVSQEDHFSKTEHGTGGIESKLVAANSALSGGVGRVFYAGMSSDLADVIDNQSGTEFYL